MFGDSRHESHARVAVDRLSELIPEIEIGFTAVGSFVKACFAGEHSDLSRLEAFHAEFYARQLCDLVALAKGYFEHLGIGPDADVLLRKAAELRDDVRDYGAELVRLADAAKGDAAAEADVLHASGELHDRAIRLNLGLLAFDGVYRKLNNLFQRFDGESEPTGDSLAVDVRETAEQNSSKYSNREITTLLKSDGVVLWYLAQRHPALCSIADIALLRGVNAKPSTVTDLSEATVKKAVTRLIDKGYATRPSGNRNGATATDNGMAVARKLHAD